MNYLYRVGESNDVTFSDQNARLFSYKMFNTLTRLRVGRILTPEILLLDDHLGILMISWFHLYDEYPVKHEADRLTPPIIADFNGDGKKEVIVATNDAKIQVS
ncbi:hypothetical protein YC2023_101936 [Brassica napus]